MTRGERVIAFIERYCIVPEGKLIGRSMELADFQRRFILEVYDNPAGTREGILSIGRKNGKTGLIAALLLAHLAGPEAVENSQIVSGAQSRDQAGMVWNYAAKMAAMSPELAKRVRSVPSGKRLIGLSRNVEYRALSAEAKTAHGLSPVLVILDELGQVEGAQDDFVDALETAQGAYENALRLVISTQAATDADLLSIKIDDAKTSKDPRIVCHVYEAPADCDLLDRAAWKASNPALGIFRSEQDVLDQAERAARLPSAENTFRNLILNQRVQMHSPFISPSVWKECGEAPAPLHGLRVVGGLDLSQSLDLTALLLDGIDDDGIHHWHPIFWTPADTLADRARRDRAPYETWVKQGFMRATPGKAVDYEIVARDIAEVLGDTDIGSIGYDRWRINLLQREFDAAGLSVPLEPFGQGYRDMTPAIEEVEKLMLDRRVRHGMHPVLTYCAANAVVVKDPSGNRKLDKSRSTGRIDGMVAAVMAAGTAQRATETQVCVEAW